MRLWGRWIERLERDDCDCHQRKSPRLTDALGSIWECRHGNRWVLRVNHMRRAGYISTHSFRWEEA